MKTRLLGLGESGYGQLWRPNKVTPADTSDGSQPQPLGIDVSKPLSEYVSGSAEELCELIREDQTLFTSNDLFLNHDYNERHEIVQVACGSLHTLLLTSTGTAYGLGDDDYGQCGIGISSRHVYVPRKIAHLKNMFVKSIDAGGWFSLFITSDKKLRACGEICLTPDFMVLERAQKAVPTLTEHFAEIDVTKIHGCANRSFIVQASDFQLYAQGDNSKGCCGVNEDSVITRPTKVKKIEGDNISNFDHPVLSISGGQDFMAILDCDQRLWISGSLRQQVSSRVFYEPFARKPAVEMKSVVSIATGWELLVVLTLKGDVYVVSDDHNFAHISFPAPIRSITCGATYCCLTGANNHYYGYGVTGYHQLGHHYKPLVNTDLDIDYELFTDDGKYQTVAVAAGYDHTIFLQVMRSNTIDFVSKLYSCSVRSKFTDISVKTRW